MASIYIETFGCQMNEADSQYIADRAFASGYSVTADVTEASVVVLNTCTVRGASRVWADGALAFAQARRPERQARRLRMPGRAR